jgi:hypothetical protein
MKSLIAFSAIVSAALIAASAFALEYHSITSDLRGELAKERSSSSNLRSQLAAEQRDCLRAVAACRSLSDTNAQLTLTAETLLLDNKRLIGKLEDTGKILVRVTAALKERETPSKRSSPY